MLPDAAFLAYRRRERRRRIVAACCWAVFVCLIVFALLAMTGEG